MVGEQIKRGRRGPTPRIADVLWRGSAEVSVPLGTFARLPAALVRTDRGEEEAVIQLAGGELDADRWWDARVVSSREWEGADGKPVGDTDPAMVARINSALRSATLEHDAAGRELAERVRMGTFRFIPE